MKKILSFGEILWDVIAGRYYLGGAPLNFAAHAVQCGLQSSILSCLGEDNLGDKALRAITKLKVRTNLIRRMADKNTGAVQVRLADGQPNYEILKDTAYDFIQYQPADLSDIKKHSVFYFGTLAQRGLVSKKSMYHLLEKVHFETVFYDVNLRKGFFSKSIIEKSLSLCTILKMNNDEMRTIGKLCYDQVLDFEALAKKLTSQYAQLQIIIMTIGKNGCALYYHEHLVRIPGVSTIVKDTIGAGDAFSAAFLAIYSKTNDPKRAAMTANIVGGFVASSDGAIPTYTKNIRQLF